MSNLRPHILLLLVLASATLIALSACNTAEPTGPIPSGHEPFVEFDAPFGDAPLTGNLHLEPLPTTRGWRYRVEFPGEAALEGVIEDSVVIPYRLEAVGSHRVRIELTGPDGTVVVEKRLVATDPASDFEVLDLLPVEEIWPDAGSALSPEGIALDMYEVWLFVANYGTGEVFRIDAGTFDSLPGYGARLDPSVEGLAVTPSGSRLLSAHKYSLFSVFPIQGEAPIWVQDGIGEFFVEVIDESHALVSGFPLAVVNINERLVEHRAAAFHAGHFAIDRSRGRIAVSNLSNGSVDILSLPTLSTIRSIALTGFHPAQVAFDPHENKVYVMAKADGQSWFIVLDPTTGGLLATVPVGPGACSGYCVANPVATFGGGRYVAFEQSSSVLIVDTDTDQPRYRFGSAPVGVRGGPAGVAALPDSDVLYVLGGPYDALTKIRLQGTAGP